MVNRKQFLHLSAASAAGLILPGFLNGKENSATAEADRLAAIALAAARKQGAAYADVRIARSKHAGAYEAGIRMLINGHWVFVSTADITAEGITKAMANAKAGKERYQYDLKAKHEVWRCVFPA